jgi:MFS transporter, ACS family, tartrate transporter
MPASFLSGRSAAAGYAIVGCMGILGGFVGPAWMGWLKDLTGGYRIGLMSMAIPGVLAAALSLLLGRENFKEPVTTQF